MNGVESIAMSAPAVTFGVGLFETLLVTCGRALQVDEHYERMRVSAEALAIAAPPRAAFDDAIAQVIARHRTNDEAALRVSWLAEEAALERLASWRFSVQLHAVSHTTLDRRVDARAMTLRDGEVRALPRHKSTSYAVCLLALRQAIGNGANEALFLDAHGRVLEGTSTNVFAVSGSTLVTAPLDAGILPGTVRQWVLDQAPQLGLTIEERTPSIEELHRGAFLTSSLTTIAPLREIDGVECATPSDTFIAVRNAWHEACELDAS